MYVSETVQVARAPHDVFTALAEPEWQSERVGWRSLERSNGAYAGVLQATAGPIAIDFDCRFEVVEAEPDERLRIRGQGVSPRMGFTVDARFHVRGGDGTTTVELDADIEVAGALAGLGQRRIGEQARRLLASYISAS